MHPLSRSLFMACCLIACAALPAPAVADEARLEGLTYLTEQYYPYNYSEGDSVLGFSTELLRLTWARLGVPDQPISVQPWARVYESALSRPHTVAFTMARTAEREDLFRWACPIDTARFALFSRAADKSRILSSANFDNLIVGTVRDDVADAALRDSGRATRIETVAEMELNLRKLDAGRLDLVAYEERSMRGLLERLGKNPADYTVVSVLKETEVCFAFHRETPIALVERFQQALREVIAGPDYARLAKKYLQ